MKSYVLIWRVPKGGLYSIDWDKPTGGMIMEPRKVLTTQCGRRLAIVDWSLARSVAHERYHCGPGEELILAEVFEPAEQRLAKVAHLRWELEIRSFLQLMEV